MDVYPVLKNNDGSSPFMLVADFALVTDGGVGIEQVAVTVDGFDEEAVLEAFTRLQRAGAELAEPKRRRPKGE